ncbi:MAG TPA: glycine/betaine ABC transporter permease [Holosporales bacterium]|nr:glycine/betaine ABC transporter permease [Holosporales bacterium]
MKTYALFDDSFFTHNPWWMPVKLYRVVCQRSNPRSKEYMITLLQEKFPGAELADSNQLDHLHGKIILLYTDAIGLGFRTIEKKLKTQKLNIRVLNGRKRDFELTSCVHRRLLIHRFLEITFLPEILLTPFVLLYGFFLALNDKVKG